MRLVVSASLIVLLGIAACSTGGGGNALPPLPPRQDPLSQLEVVPKRPDIPPPKVGEGEEFTSEQRDFMGRAFKDFMREEPEWPALRTQWEGLGPRAVKALVENLFVYLLAAQNAARPDAARRAQTELVDLGPASVPHLIGTLKLRHFPDRQGNRQPVDELTRQTVAETLALIGAPAVSEMVRILPGAPDGSRRVIVKALADVPGPPATAALLTCLNDDNFVVAAQAAWALRTHPGRDVTARLVAVFGDLRRDVTVREHAGKALLRRRDPAVVPALVDVMDRAVAVPDYALLKSTGLILRRTTGLTLPDDPKAWREVLAGGRKR